MPDIVVIGSPGDRRIELFQAALAGLRWLPARVVSYLDLLTRRVNLAEMIGPETFVRIESPGKQPEVERALLAHGADQPETEQPDKPYERFTREMLARIPQEKGRILSSRQWYLGFSHLLRQVASLVPARQLSSQPDDILLMFDKRACHALLQQHNIPVPRTLAPVNSYDELLDRMQQKGWNRVFIKPAHSSSASGIVAYRVHDRHHQAITTVEMVGEERLLYNSRRIRTYTDQHEIAALIDTLCRQRVHVEQWLTRATFARRSFDLRVVVIAQQARHTVVRLSSSPFTNLHLLNERGDVDGLRSIIAPEYWQAAMSTCERAARLLSSPLAGIDLLFSPGFRQHAILEMNAFGDLLPGVLHNGHDTYTAELLAFFSPVHT